MQDHKHLTLVDLSDPFEVESLEAALSAAKGLQEKIKGDSYQKAIWVYFFRLGARWGREHAKISQQTS